MEPQQPKQGQGFSQGAALTCIAIFSVNRTVQIWSRVPGSTGGWFYGWMLFVGLALQAWYYQVNVHATQCEDLINGPLFFNLSVIWFAIHGVVRTIKKLQGTTLHSYDQGKGILCPILPGCRQDTVSLLSDLLVTTFLAGLLWLAHSPILSQWFVFMSFWLLVGHAWMKVQAMFRRQAFIDAQAEIQRFRQF